MLTTRRPTSRIDVCNYSPLLYSDYNENTDYTKDYFLSQSPPPMTYRDLRSVMSNLKSSKIVILPESLTSRQTLKEKSPQQNHRKQTARKKSKRQTVNVYRTLPRSESRCSTLPERNITNDEMILLANSFVVDHISPSPASGFFHPQNLPNIQKHRTTSNSRIESIQTKLNNSPSPSLHIRNVGHTRPPSVDILSDDNQTKSSYSSSSSVRILHARPTPPQLIHRTTPVDIQYEELDNQIAITTTTTLMNSSSISELQHRKQLHVYMPQILS